MAMQAATRYLSLQHYGFVVNPVKWAAMGFKSKGRGIIECDYCSFSTMAGIHDNFMQLHATMRWKCACVSHHMSDINNRLESFEREGEKWKVDKSVLAHAGLYPSASIFDTQDKTTCFCCNNSFSNWSVHDSPLAVHEKANRRCPFICTTVHGIQCLPSVSNITSVRKMKATFKYWSNMHVQPNELVADGFVYTSLDVLDDVMCIVCLVHLSGWQEGMSVSERHRMESPECPHHRKQTRRDTYKTKVESQRKIMDMSEAGLIYRKEGTAQCLCCGFIYSYNSAPFLEYNHAMATHAKLSPRCQYIRMVANKT